MSGLPDKYPLSLALAVLLGFATPRDVVAQPVPIDRQVTTPYFEGFRQHAARNGWFFRWAKAPDSEEGNIRYESLRVLFSFVAAGGYSYKARIISGGNAINEWVDMSGTNVSGGTLSMWNGDCRPRAVCEFEQNRDRSRQHDEGIVLITNGTTLKNLDPGVMYEVEGNANGMHNNYNPAYFVFVSDDPEIADSFRCPRCSF